MAKILKFYGSDLKLSGPCHCILLEWFRPISLTYATKLVRVIKDDKSEKSLTFKYYISTATILLLFIQGLYDSLNNSTKQLKHLILPWLLIFIAAFCHFYVNVCRTKAAEIAELINAFIQFDKMHPQNAKIISVKHIFGLAITRVLIFSQYVIPIGFVFAFHLNDPWKPSLAGYWLIPKASNQSENGSFHTFLVTGVKTIVLLYNYWIWNLVQSAVVLILNLIFNLCTSTLLDYIDTFADLCFKPTSMEGGTNFIYKRAQVFRHIQLLTAILNEIQKGSPILFMITACIITEGVALSKLVGSLNLDVEFSAILFLMVVDCSMDILIVFGEMSKVYQKSNGLIKTMQRKRRVLGVSLREWKWEQRFYRSCSALKIMISSVNFVDELTPLRCLEASISLAVDILLLNGVNT